MTLSSDASRIALHPENCTGCLTCQIRCSMTWQKTFMPAQAFIRVVPKANGFDFDISYTEDCNQCLVCARHCPYGALVIEEQGGVDDGN